MPTGFLRHAAHGVYARALAAGFFCAVFLGGAASVAAQNMPPVSSAEESPSTAGGPDKRTSDSDKRAEKARGRDKAERRQSRRDAKNARRDRKFEKKLAGTKLPQLPAVPDIEAAIARARASADAVVKKLGLDPERAARVTDIVVSTEQRRVELLTETNRRRENMATLARSELAAANAARDDVSAKDDKPAAVYALLLAARTPPQLLEYALGMKGKAAVDKSVDSTPLERFFETTGLTRESAPEVIAKIRAKLREGDPWESLTGLENLNRQAAEEIKLMLTPEEFFAVVDLVQESSANEGAGGKKRRARHATRVNERKKQRPDPSSALPPEPPRR